jgi:hypothetical protein
MVVEGCFVVENDISMDTENVYFIFRLCETTDPDRRYPRLYRKKSPFAASSGLSFELFHGPQRRVRLNGCDNSFHVDRQYLRRIKVAHKLALRN